MGTGTSIAAVVLAAGESSRMGSPKQVLDWDGVPLVRHMVNTFAMGGACEVVVVVGCRARLVAGAALAFDDSAEVELPAVGDAHGVPLRVVENVRWQLGMSSSAAVGARACRPDAHGIMVCPVDLPLLAPYNIRRLIEGYELLSRGAEGCLSAVASHNGKRGHPVIFSARQRAALEALDSPQCVVNLKQLSELGSVGRCYLVEAGSECVASDIDTPDDYRRAVRALGSTYRGAGRDDD